VSSAKAAEPEATRLAASRLAAAVMRWVIVLSLLFAGDGMGDASVLPLDPGAPKRCGAPDALPGRERVIDQ
jgi:hypothetical protein